jgi:hypothetical protein
MLLLAPLLCAGPLAGQAQPDEDLALQYTPAVVAAEVAASDIDDARVRVSVARADLDGTGTADYLVAAYSGEESGALRILKLTPSVSVVAESTQALGGRGVSLELPDVDADGIPEIAVAFSQFQGPEVIWIYRWAAGALHPMTAAQGILGCALVDVDGDGNLEAVGAGVAGAPAVDTDPSTSVMRIPVYKVDAGSFVWTDDLFYFAFAIAQISPVEREFVVPDPARSYVLRVTNGDQAGAHRVVSGEVRLNGTVVVNGGDFAGTNRAIAIVATLQETNTISIDVDGPSGGRMIVSVAFAAPYTAPPVAPLAPASGTKGTDCSRRASASSWRSTSAANRESRQRPGVERRTDAAFPSRRIAK